MADRRTNTISRGDAWAYTSEMRERVQRAMAGRSYQLSEEFLLRLIDEAERSDGVLSPEKLDSLLDEAVRSGEIACVDGTE